MIKFLGHTINLDTEDTQYTIDDRTTFAPNEVGESCLMIGINEPNYKTFLDQADFLRNVYNLMKKE